VLDAQTYAYWQSVARSHSRRASEADDLLHDALLAMRRAGRSLSSADDQAWLAGAIRNLSKMAARSAVRRRDREQAAAIDDDARDVASNPDAIESLLQRIEFLPRSLRQVAVLAINGLGRDEVRVLLDLTDDALRRRIADLRKAIGPMLDGPVQRVPMATHLELGVLRKSLLAVLLDHDGQIGTHDPDGHLIVISKNSSSQDRPPRQQNGES
jgi:DNA-directed RNA polymerase specialized sigma24 family protein